MKHFRTIAVLLAMTLAVAAQAQKYIVYSVNGGAQLITTQGPKDIKPWDVLTPSATLRIPADCTIRLIDEQQSCQYVIRTQTEASVDKLIHMSGNIAVLLNADQLKFIKSQYENAKNIKEQTEKSGKEQQATVTVKDKPEKEGKSESLMDKYRSEFEGFKKATEEEFDRFRKAINEEYAEFSKQCWKNFKSDPPKQQPKIDDVKPITLPVPKKDEGKKIPTRPITIEEVITPVLPEPQPLPIEPIPEDERSKVSETVVFQFFGTELKVRFDKDDRIALSGLTPAAIAEGWKKLSGKAYNNALADCLHYRQELKLGDWAYLQLLRTAAEACMGKGNEATLFMAYMFCQTGYQMRLAVTPGQLHMLYACRHVIYGKSYFTLAGEMYYPLTGEPREMSICDLPYPAERGLSLIITENMNIALSASPERTFQSKAYQNVHATTSVNRNLIDFYDGYPSSEIGGNLMTRWATYANTPLSPIVQEQFYPALRKELQGLSPYDAVSRLLNLVQTSLVYEYDDKVWGHDRAFFPEESLFYPYADCEDRSALFTRLVRDLVKLKTVLIYYPGHLAAAVEFPEPVDGDYLTVEGRRFTICDPTYINAPVGRTMPSMDNSVAKAIILP